MGAARFTHTRKEASEISVGFHLLQAVRAYLDRLEDVAINMSDLHSRALNAAFIDESAGVLSVICDTKTPFLTGLSGVRKIAANPFVSPHIWCPDK